MDVGLTQLPSFNARSCLNAGTYGTRRSLHIDLEVIILPLSYTTRRPAVAATEPLTTTVSTKGQVILPKAVRQRRHWEPGTRLVVEETPEGVLLKAAPMFAPTRPEDVAGMLAYRGRTKTLEEMDAAITAEVKQRRARGRY
jgi:AbrB family looped-hinge helix DNA binding protein